MEGLLGSATQSSFNLKALSLSYNRGNSQENLLVIEATLQSSQSQGNLDQVDVGISDLTKGLALTAQQIVDKLNEILKSDLPEGVQSLKPEEVTPEATADRIVNGATALFDIFKEQHKDLDGEELLRAFMETIKRGIQSGYDDAFKTLDSLGAFQFDGVQSGVEKTKQLIDEKLSAYEDFKRKELGLEGGGLKSEDLIAPVKSNLLAQAGAGLLSVRA